MIFVQLYWELAVERLAIDTSITRDTGVSIHGK